MKYGQIFYAQSVPQWAPYNVDYNELKNLIKVHTTKNQGQAIAIPGQGDESLEFFEDLFFNELANQHDRVDLFVKSKTDEIKRRLQFLEKVVYRLLAKCSYKSNEGKSISQKSREKFAKYDIQIERCGEEIRSLQRFVAAQRMAFHKILKKYRKWTGSRALGERFNDEILGNPKSFVRRDLEPLLAQYRNLLSTLRASTPDATIPTTPSSSRRASLRPIMQTPASPVAQQAYWNEYDDGSEAENEPYMVSINPEEDVFPGAKTIEYIVSLAKKPVNSVRWWFSPGASSNERSPLLGETQYFNEQQSTLDTDIDEDGDASSSDFPSGYTTYYATFPSPSDQKLSLHREKLLFQAMIGCFVASFVLLLVAGLLVSTGKKKLRVEVDAGVLVGVVASLFFATMGYGAMLCRAQKLSWTYRSCVGLTFIISCIMNGILLVYMAGN